MFTMMCLGMELEKGVDLEIGLEQFGDISSRCREKLLLGGMTLFIELDETAVASCSCTGVNYFQIRRMILLFASNSEAPKENFVSKRVLRFPYFVIVMI